MTSWGTEVSCKNSHLFGLLNQQNFCLDYFCQNKYIIQQYNCVWRYGSVVETSARFMQWGMGEAMSMSMTSLFRIRSFICISNLKGYLSGECVSMINNWHAIISIPAVQLYAPTALKQHLMKNYIRWSDTNIQNRGYGSWSGVKYGSLAWL